MCPTVGIEMWGGDFTNNDLGLHASLFTINNPKQMGLKCLTSKGLKQCQGQKWSHNGSLVMYLFLWGQLLNPQNLSLWFDDHIKQGEEKTKPNHPWSSQCPSPQEAGTWKACILKGTKKSKGLVHASNSWKIESSWISHGISDLKVALSWLWMCPKVAGRIQCKSKWNSLNSRFESHLKIIFSLIMTNI